MPAKKDQLFTSRPAHSHHNANGDTWLCNSPYCDDPGSAQDHPDDGGPKPIMVGYEPWRR